MPDLFANPITWVVIAVIAVIIITGLVLLVVAAWKFYILFLEVLEDKFMGEE